MVFKYDTFNEPRKYSYGIQPWRWLLPSSQNGDLTQKNIISIVTAVRTLNPAQCTNCLSHGNILMALLFHIMEFLGLDLSPTFGYPGI
jgi:hypothetical protein